MVRLIIIISIFLAGCTTPYTKIGTTLTEIRPQIVNSYSFSFLYKGDEYFFAPQHFKQKDRKCYLYLGFKNEKLTYAFSQSLFYAFEKTFAEKQSPEAIKRKIIETVRKQKPTTKRCFELGSGPPSDSGQGVALLVLLYPITIPLMSYYFALEQVDKNFLRKVSSQIHLGMAKHKVPKSIKKKWRTRRKGKYAYYVFQERHLKMIMYFKDNKLNAWSQLYVK